VATAIAVGSRLFQTACELSWIGFAAWFGRRYERDHPPPG
jgi:hypothetical protein